MGCALFRIPAMTKRDAQTLAHDGDESKNYSCFLNGTPKPVCKQAGRCICLDGMLPPMEGFECGEGVTACKCGYVAEYLCDFPMGRGKTCDAELCEACAIPVLPVDVLPDEVTRRRDPEARVLYLRRSAVISDLHYCPAHSSDKR